MLGPFATASRFTLPFTRCRYTPPAHRCLQRQRRQRQRVTEGPLWPHGMDPTKNGPNKVSFDLDLFVCMGYDHSSPGIEGQGQTSKVKVRGRNAVGWTSILNR